MKKIKNGGNFLGGIKERYQKAGKITGFFCSLEKFLDNTLPSFSCQDNKDRDPCKPRARSHDPFVSLKLQMNLNSLVSRNKCFFMLK